MKKKHKIELVVGAFLIFVVIISLFVFQAVQNKTDIDLDVISLEEFQHLIQATKFEKQIFVYVGRDSCPTCTTIYPTLCTIKSKNKLEMMYYSTELDRDIRPEILNDFLNTINVDHVPMIVVFAGGMIQDVYDGEEFIKAYL